MTSQRDLIVTTSWDDGTKTDVRLAELLEKYGIKGTFYISRAATDNLLSPGDIVALSKKFEIGAHTMNHPDLTRISLPQATNEIKDSKEYLQDLVGQPVVMFCYPKGGYNETVKKIVKDLGFIGARICNPGGFKPPQDPYLWHMTMLASNGSPLMALKICLKARLWQPGAFLDWESRARQLFNLALRSGGIYHIYGHSEELERNNGWAKLESLLSYISGKDKVCYMANREIFELISR